MGHHWMESYGYIGIMMTLMFPFIPSEVPLAYAGYLVHTAQANLLFMLFLAVVSFVISQNLFFTIGQFGSERLLNRLFKWFRISETKMLQFQTQMETKGRYILLLSPMWRIGFAIGAGLTGVSRWTFTVVTTISFFLWSAIFIWGGKAVGHEWQKLHHLNHPIVWIGLGVLITVGYLIQKKRKTKKEI
ncbi:MAG: DedA family protein [Exiguobacterium indicum]